MYRQKVETEFDPLDNELNKHRAEMARLFDQYYDNPLFKKTDKSKIKHLVCEICGNLIAEFGMDELKPLFNKYSDDDYDAINQETDAAIGDIMKGIAENIFNVKLEEDVDISSPEKFRAHLEEKLRGQAEEQPATPVKQRKKTKKQLETLCEAQDEQSEVEEIYSNIRI